MMEWPCWCFHNLSTWGWLVSNVADDIVVEALFLHRANLSVILVAHEGYAPHAHTSWIHSVGHSTFWLWYYPTVIRNSLCNTWNRYNQRQYWSMCKVLFEQLSCRCYVCIHLQKSRMLWWAQVMTWRCYCFSPWLITKKSGKLFCLAHGCTFCTRVSRVMPGSLAMWAAMW